MPHNAVVLSGGGAKGSYEIGVWKALNEIGFNYDTVVGTSVGAINAALMVQGEYEPAEKMWLKIKTEMVFDIDESAVKKSIKGMLNIFAEDIIKNRGVDATPLKNLMNDFIDEKKVRNSSKNFGLVTVSYPKLKPRCLFKEDIEEGKLIDYIMASSACFPALKSYNIGGTEYIDGGYYNNLPIEMAALKGADCIVAVNLKAVGVVRKFVPKSEKIINITPKWDLGAMLFFNPEGIKQSELNIKLGYLDTLKAFEKIDGYKYAFEKKYIDQFFDENKNKICKKVQLIGGFAQNEEKNNRNIKLTSIALNMIKAARQIAGKQLLSKKEILIALSEITGESFEISPYNCYNFYDYSKAIQDKANDNKYSDYVDIIKNRKISFTYENIKTSIKNLSEFDKVRRIKFILSILEDEERKNDNMLILTALSTVMINEFIAAYFIYIMS